MRLLVTGGRGMLGRAVAQAAVGQGHDVHAPGRDELDVTNFAALACVVAERQPEAIVNCAAWTDVDAAESDPEAANAVNAEAPRHLAEVVGAAGTCLVHLSSDYVFAGEAKRPYVESDPVGPRTAYGRSKLAGELALAELVPGAAVVRTAWLFGAGGRNFVDTVLAMGERRDEVDVVSDQVGSPTWTGHLGPALVKLAEGHSAGVHHVAGGGECSWFTLAREAFAVAGLACRVRPTDTASMPRVAPRPAYSALASERPEVPRLPGWREGVRAFLASRGAGARVAS